MTWVINGLIVWFFTYALTAKIRLELVEEKEARLREKQELELELFRKSKELGDLEQEFYEYKLLNGEIA